MNFWQKLKQLIVLAASASLLMVAAAPAVAGAASSTDAIQNAIEGGINNAAGNTGNSAEAANKVNDTIANIVNVLSAIVGVVAVIMLIVAGYRYITSGGSAEKVKSAKDTLVYAVVGLIIVALAQVIVRFVLHHATAPVSGSNANSSQNHVP